MGAPAAPIPGRRASLGAAAVLAGFLLLAPPLYVLGPFALLTLLRRPRTTREFFWLALAAAGVSASLVGPVMVGPQIIRVSGIALSAIFVILSLRGRGAPFPRALMAVALTALTVVLWSGTQGLSYAQVETGFIEMLQASYRALVDAAGADPKARQDVQSFVQPFIAAAPDIGRYLPALLGLEALAGALLAWDWHHRISAQPLGRGPGRFRDFRFNDHLVWGAIFTLGLLLVPFPPPGGAIAANILVVWAGLYVFRGLAIVATVLAPTPGPLKLLAALLAVLLFPVVLGACLALGLADTWLDIRGRLAPPVPEGD